MSFISVWITDEDWLFINCGSIINAGASVKK